MNTPAKGPISEYGAYRTANAAAPFAGFGYVATLKKTYVPRPAVKMPSPVCEITLVDSSRRKSCSVQTMRRSCRKDPCCPGADGSGRPGVCAPAGTGGVGSCLDTGTAYGARPEQARQPRRSGPPT